MNKICLRCKIEKDLFGFHKDHTRKDGLNPYCKKCASEKAKKYAKMRDKDKRADYEKKFYLENRERILNRCAVYREENKETIKKKSRIYYKKNRERLLKYGREDHLRNKDRNNKKYREAQSIRKKRWEGILPRRTSCEVCGKDIYFVHKEHNNRICFDHKTDDVVIKINPSSWLRQKVPSSKNVKIWKSCDFGMLCSECNIAIPTRDRKEWLKNITKYINKNRGANSKNKTRQVKLRKEVNYDNAEK